jgi:nitrite reductase (NO-forming)/hydroxylamine reductase
MKILKALKRHAALAAMLAIAAPLAAQAQDKTHEKKGVTEPELKYQAGASPLATEPMYQSANPQAPPMTQAEFDSARKI